MEHRPNPNEPPQPPKPDWLLVFYHVTQALLNLWWAAMSLAAFVFLLWVGGCFRQP